MRVILAEPRGFCAGVERAIQIVELALKKYGPPVYVRHEIVHNRRVVEELRQKGARFVDELHEIPDGAITVFSAHGVAEKVQAEAEQRALPVIDATCPLVAKVHMEGQRYAGQRRDVVLIGHRGHPEVEGTLGRINGPVHLVSTIDDVAKLRVADEGRIAYVTQTTLSVDDTRSIIEALTARFPKIVGPDVKDICYATQNRQHAVRMLARQVQLLIVVGSNNSSNSNRLREIGADCGVPSYLVDTVEAIEPRWFDGISVVGVSAGASAPEGLVQEVVRHLNGITPITVERLQGIAENVRFKLPRELASLASAAD